MLGADGNKIPWAVARQASITWENDGQFLRELEAQVTQEETQMNATVEALHAREVFTRDEADSVRPRLVVTVLDDRKAGSPPLPKMDVRDPRTVLTFQAR